MMLARSGSSVSESLFSIQAVTDSQLILNLLRRESSQLSTAQSDQDEFHGPLAPR